MLDVEAVLTGLLRWWEPTQARYEPVPLEEQHAGHARAKGVEMEMTLDEEEQPLTSTATAGSPIDRARSHKTRTASTIWATFGLAAAFFSLAATSNKQESS